MIRMTLKTHPSSGLQHMLILMLVAESDVLERTDLSMKLISVIAAISVRAAVIVSADAWSDIDLYNSAASNLTLGALGLVLRVLYHNVEFTKIKME
jgi:hypothetical protein